jgi:hypothetical protein
VTRADFPLLGPVQKVLETFFQAKVGIALLTHGEVVSHFLMGNTVQLPVQILVDPFESLGTCDRFTGRLYRLLFFGRTRRRSPTPKESLQTVRETHDPPSGFIGSTLDVPHGDCKFVQFLLKQPASSKEPALHGADRDLGHLCDFLIGEAFEVGKNHGGAIVLGKGLNML